MTHTRFARLTKTLAAALCSLFLGLSAYAEPPEPPEATLTLTIQAQKTDILIGEPLVLDVFLANEGNVPTTAPSRLDMIGFVTRLELETGEVQRFKNFTMYEITGMEIPSVQLTPGTAVAQRVIIDRDITTGRQRIEQPGEHQLSLSLLGHTSNTVTVTVTRPWGADAAAWRDLQRRRERLSQLPYATLEDRLAQLDAMEAEDRAFINRFAHTVYAKHRRLALAEQLLVDYTNLRAAKPAEAIEVVEPLVTSDSTFVRQDEAYAAVMECSYKLGDVDKARQAKLELDTKFANGPTAARLSKREVRFGEAANRKD